MEAKVRDMRPKLVYILLLICATFNVEAQITEEGHTEGTDEDTLIIKSVYRFDKQYRKNDLFINTASAGLLTFTYFYTENQEVLTRAEIEGLDITDVPRFERDVVFMDNERAGTISDYLLISSFVLPATLSVTMPKGIEKLNSLYLMMQTLLASNSLNAFTKVITGRRRPFVYNPDISVEEKLSRDAIASFYSGHASISASMAFFSAKMVHDRYPDKKIKYYVWPMAAILPAGVALLRVRAGKHFISDVLIGYGIGAFTGYIIPWMHHFHRYDEKELKPDRAQIFVTPTGTGMAMTLRF